jgi:hypothetical protein
MTLSQFFQSCSTLPGSIKSYESKEDYLREFKQLFDSQEARNISNVLYAFVCKEKIPRVKEASNIIYIGRTVQKLRDRYQPYHKDYCSDYNWAFYSYVIKHYGAVSLAYLIIDTRQSLKEAESDLLRDYYNLHRESPPKNSQGYGSWGGAIKKL